MIETIFIHPWTWIMAISIGLFLLLTIVSVYLWIRADEVWSVGTIAGGLVTLILSGAYFGAMLPPYDSSFYNVYKITGELTEVESAFSGDEGTMSQVFIAKVDGVDYYIKSDDQRFRTLDVGDEVSLVCDKKFQYFVQPWYDCSFAG